MISDLDDSLAAVLAEPNADAPRLVYASACEAHGDSERAEFVRLQVQSIAARRKGDEQGELQGFQRELALRKRFGDQWAGPVRDSVKSFQFFRGFVEWIAVDAAYFLTHADELYAIAPIRMVALRDAVPVLKDLGCSPHLARLVWLSLENQQIEDHGVELLAESPYLRNIAYLGLAGTGMSAAGVETLAASPHLPALRRVTGLPKEFEEEEWWDQGKTIDVISPCEAPTIERKYGPKAWLHPMTLSGWRGIDERDV
jgi:uncharacterized protein (TIGR02996 family)